MICKCKKIMTKIQQVYWCQHCGTIFAEKMVEPFISEKQRKKDIEFYYKSSKNNLIKYFEKTKFNKIEKSCLDYYDAVESLLHELKKETVR